MTSGAPTAPQCSRIRTELLMPVRASLTLTALQRPAASSAATARGWSHVSSPMIGIEAAETSRDLRSGRQRRSALPGPTARSRRPAARSVPPQLPCSGRSRQRREGSARPSAPRRSPSNCASATGLAPDFELVGRHAMPVAERPRMVDNGRGLAVGKDRTARNVIRRATEQPVGGHAQRLRPRIEDSDLNRAAGGRVAPQGHQSRGQRTEITDPQAHHARREDLARSSRTPWSPSRRRSPVAGCTRRSRGRLRWSVTVTSTWSARCRTPSDNEMAEAYRSANGVALTAVDRGVRGAEVHDGRRRRTLRS